MIITDGMYRKASQRLILRSIADKFNLPFFLIKTEIDSEKAKAQLEMRAQEGGLGGWVEPSEYEMPYDQDLIRIENDGNLDELKKRVETAEFLI